MTVKTVNVQEAGAILPRLIEQVARGEEVVIAKSGQPIARLVPWVASEGVRSGGEWRGRVHIAPDFDAPLPSDIEAGFRGRT